MSVSEISISNLAISWLGGNLITSFQDEGSTEADLCSANYEFSRDAVLEDRDWTFALTRWMPNKLGTEPLFGFSSAFQLPADYIRMTEISHSPKFDKLIEEWEKENDTILCNHDVIYIRYVRRIVDPTKFSPGFVQALAARIAADICVPLTHDVDLFQTYWQLYLNKLQSGGANDGLQSRTRVARSDTMIKIR